jgi:adenylosuccinate lyase
MRGYAQAGLENVALWHERDISHSGAERVILPDATIGLDYMQHLGRRVASEMVVHSERMRENLELTYGAIYSQRALTALLDAGLTRDHAYRIIQANAQRAWDSRTPFRELLAEAIAADAEVPEVDLDAVFDPGAYLRNAGDVFERLEQLAAA